MSSTARQELHRHLAELEQGEVFSHERLEKMASLVDAISPTPLPVVAIGDAELVDKDNYHVRYDNEWYYDAEYDTRQEGFWSYGSLIEQEFIDYVCAAEATTKALNTAVEGLR